MAEEVIAGYRVHPAASLFPLIQGDEFDELVESIMRSGVHHPIVVRRGKGGDELLDGRNRLRAVAEARERGCVVSVPVTEWRDDDRNVAEWIWDTNGNRRHLTEDAWAIVCTSVNKLISAEAEARQKATRFTSEKASTAAKARHAVTTKTEEPQKRDRKAENARSTVGQVAAKAGVSMHKARQAIAALDAVEAGTVTPEALDEVKAGKKKLRDVVPKKPATTARKHRTMQELLTEIRDIVAEWKNADHNPEVLKDELKTHIERL